MILEASATICAGRPASIASDRCINPVVGVGRQVFLEIGIGVVAVPGLGE